MGHVMDALARLVDMAIAGSLPSNVAHEAEVIAAGWWRSGPGCTLLAFVDDATSRLMLLRFVPRKSAFSYFGAM